MTTSNSPKKTKPPATSGFGFLPEESQHHFLVTIPAKKDGHVLISEHHTWDDADARRELSFALGKEDDKLRVSMARDKWDGIADAVRKEFNERLKRNGIKTGAWKRGRVAVSRLFGKELVLLAWAIEDADPALIPTAVRNWLGLAPEERWWLYTMTAAATGHATAGRNKGWRKAVRFALTENPISEEVEVDRGDLETFDLFFGVSEEEAKWGSSKPKGRKK
ncbi:MAG: hypothetical protein PWP23_3145 [Candidatus Sumerlaeota bacterium]|nr:hypothetical protein [Candidatus Sumerlaeota bacterium]